RGSQQGLLDTMRLETVHLQDRDETAPSDAMAALVDYAGKWEKPVFPVKGQDLIDRGMQPGKQLGEKLSSLEEKWVASGFDLTKAELLIS
ncbi:MAG: CCA tRNA nucleotidyltransferase, partial [Pseudomonadota bacterium]